MKQFIATYDIEAAPGDPHNNFLVAAFARGWTDTLTVRERSERLPTSTLIGSFRDLDDAHQSFEAAVSDASEAMSPAKVNVERRYIVGWSAPGEKDGVGQDQYRAAQQPAAAESTRGRSRSEVIGGCAPRVTHALVYCGCPEPGSAIFRCCFASVSAVVPVAQSDPAGRPKAY